MVLLRIRLIDFDLHQAGHDLIMAPRMAELGDGAGVASALVGRVTSVSAIRMDSRSRTRCHMIPCRADGEERDPERSK